MHKNFGVQIRKLDIPSRHHNFCDFEGLFGVVCGKTSAAAPTKTGNEISGKPTSEDIGAYTHHCPGVEHGVDATFAVIAHHQTAKLKACSFKVFRFIIP